MVENLGRVNAGWKICDRKGLLGDVFANGARKHFGYKMYPIPLDTLPDTYDAAPVPNTPTFYKFRLRRVLLLRSDIRPQPSGIRYASFEGE